MKFLNRLNEYFIQIKQGLPQEAIKKWSMRGFTLVVIMTIGLLHGFAKNSFGQQISLDGKNIAFYQLIDEIRSQSGYDFVIPKGLLKEAKTVTIHVKKQSLEDVLKLCIQNQNFTYEIHEDTKVVYMNEKGVVDKVKDFFTDGGAAHHPGSDPGSLQLITVTGRVTDSLRQPIAGATIKVKNGKVSTSSSANGQFTLKNVPTGATLQLSAMGYQTKEVAAKENLGTEILFVSQSPLDEVQVIAYGQTSKRLNTGNSSGITAEDIGKQPVNNPLLSLQGRVPGILITQTTGLPGTSLKIRIQGAASLNSGVEPFYVVDGVPFTSTLLSTSYTGNVLGKTSPSLNDPSGSPGNPFSYLNTSDIESIEVLKDADATAIYGSRAANGAILITTKKGKYGETRIDVDVRHGSGKVTRRAKLLNTQQYMEMRREAKRNDNEAVLATDYDLNGTWDTTRYTDWQDVFFGKAAENTLAQLSVSGGSANTSYLLGTTYSKETTVTPGDFADKKAAVHFNLNTSSPNQKFAIQLTSNYVVDNNRLQSLDVVYNALYLPPVAPALTKEDGSINWAENANGIPTWLNGTQPLAVLQNYFESKTNNLISNLLLTYNVFSGLYIRLSSGYTYLQTNEILKQPSSAVAPYYRNENTAYSYFTNNYINSYLIEPQINYASLLWKGKLNILLGGTIQKNGAYGQRVGGYNFIDDNLMGSLSAAGQVFSDGTVSSEYKYNAIFSRINYNYKDKYLLNYTLRRDGSSRFGKDRLFHNFSAIGAAWVFTQEHWFTVPSFFSFGKLKASYGTTGNDQIGNYTYLDLYQPYPVENPYQQIPVLETAGLSNTTLQWELTKKTNVGIDLGFINDRFLIGVNYGVNKVSNLLRGYLLPATTGFTSIIKNFPGIIQNTSWEFTLNMENFKSRGFAWTTNLNFTIPRNKLVSYPLAYQETSLLTVGQPLSIIKAYHYLGIDPQKGIQVVEDLNGNATSNPNYATDANRFVNIDPPYYGGINNSFSYKGVKIDFLFQFIKQKSVRFRRSPFGYDPGFIVNQPVYVLDRWQNPGDITSVKRYKSSFFTGGNELVSLSDANYEDGSYIRLKNVALSWELPAAWMHTAKIKGIRIYMNAQNLLTITKYSGLDPESGLTGVPPLQTIVFGAQLHF